MHERPPRYITTSLPYVNAPPHIGFALELIYADILARYHRLCGDDVVFLTGTDEHGQKISRKAHEQGKTPQQFVDETSDLFRILGKRLNTTTTDFYRTTDERHRVPVEMFWRKVASNGFIYKKTYAGLYCVGCEAFKTEKELVDGTCPDHLTVPERIEDENYFFKLSAFQEKLKAFYAKTPEYVIPDARFNEARQLVEGGLEDISISRSTRQLTWGIPVPDDPSQVIYVWFDALINYVSAVGFGTDGEMFARYWPVATHIIGKDINRFHAVLWTAMCMAADVPPPHQIGIHGWIHADGQKMSKSLGNVIDPGELIDVFGSDAVRYLCARTVPFSGDGDYAEALFRDRYHADLANNLGNLVSRVTSMVTKYCDGTLAAAGTGDLGETWATYHRLMDSFKFDQTLDAVWKVSTEINQRIDMEKPWTLAKSGETEKLATLLATWTEHLRHIAWMIRPFLPETSDSILDRLSEPRDRDGKTFNDVSHWGGLEPGRQIASGDPLFPRIETPA